MRIKSLLFPGDLVRFADPLAYNLTYDQHGERGSCYGSDAYDMIGIVLSRTKATYTKKHKHLLLVMLSNTNKILWIAEDQLVHVNQKQQKQTLYDDFDLNGYRKFKQ